MSKNQTNNKQVSQDQDQSKLNDLSKQTNQNDSQKKIEELQKKCDAMQACRDEYLAGWQRAKADYSNREKDIAREKMEFIKFANESLILEFVPVFDNFREAMLHIPDEQKTADWVIGIEQIKKQMNDFLKNLAVEAYGKEGEQFDPSLYEALDEVKRDRVEPGKIVKVVKVGYKLHGKVIRAGQAIVAR